MTVLVGYSANHQGKEALHLGAMLARTAGVDVVVCVIVPAPWLPGRSQVDSEHQAHRTQLAEHALDQARAEMPGNVPAHFVTHQARSAPIGLLDAADQHAAALIVLGSSTAGMFGHITLSSVAARLLHSSPLPIALATRGFRCEVSETVTRVTVSYGGPQQSEALVGAARLVATRIGASMRLVAFAVQPPAPVTAHFGVEADMVRVWSAEMQASARETLQQHAADAVVPDPLELVVAYGRDWAEALDDVRWEPGDVLVVGSGSGGLLARVFLGSHAAKIIRSSPVPVLVVPRAAAGELATEGDGERGQST